MYVDLCPALKKILLNIVLEALGILPPDKEGFRRVTEVYQTVIPYRECRFPPEDDRLMMKSEGACSQLGARIKWGTGLWGIRRVVEGPRRRMH